MKLHGAELVAVESTSDGFFFKCIANESEVAFFSGAIQHRDLKIASLSYEDDYRGNAVAGTITKGVIDVRFHEKYSDEKIAKIFASILESPEVASIAGYCVRYQGRVLIPTGVGLKDSPAP